MIKALTPLFFAVVLITSCHQQDNSIKPTTSAITESVYASGIVKSKGQYQAYSTASGIIKEVFVKEGDSVGEGSPIMLITNESQRLSKSNAELTALLSDYNLNQGKLNEAHLQEQLAYNKMKNDSLMYFRQAALWQQQIGSKAELEQRQLIYESSKATWYSAQVRKEDLDRQLSITGKQAKNNVGIAASLGGDYVLRSEMAGKVYFLYKSKGELVSPQTPVAVIGASGEFTIELQVDENDITRLEPGQQALIVMDAYKGQVFEAGITHILPMMDERTQSFTVEAAFLKMPHKLHPNTSLEANIKVNEKKDALLLPREYVKHDSLVKLRNGKYTAIKTGLKDYQYIEVLSGISADDEILKPEE
jgi:multidrug efflux pump subunit AcrA (membrane-fusion protein)